MRNPNKESPLNSSIKNTVVKRVGGIIMTIFIFVFRKKNDDKLIIRT